MMYDSHVRSELVRRFPVTEGEANCLLSAYDRYNGVTEDLDDSNSKSSLFSSSTNNATDEEDDSNLRSIFCHALHTVFVTGKVPGDEELSRKLQFFEASVSLLGRRGERFPLDSIYNVTVNHDSSGTPLSNRLAFVIYRLGQEFCRLECAELQKKSCDVAVPRSWLEFFSTMSKDQRHPSLLEWREWVNQKIPCASLVLSQVFQRLLLGKECSRPLFSVPCLPEGVSTDFWENDQAPIPMQLALMNLGGQWRRLFTSREDGLSFCSFQKALTSFVGPTIILIQTTKEERLGYFSRLPWKTSTTWQTGHGEESFLFRLHPFWSVYHPASADGSCKFHQFLNSLPSFKKAFMSGLAVGGVAPNLPRLHITQSLENCKATSFGSVYESGPLLANEDSSYFEVECLEIWAVGMENEDTFKSGMESGMRAAAVKESARQQCARVDPKQFVDDLKNGGLENHLFQHREQTRGRASFDAD